MLLPWLRGNTPVSATVMRCRVYPGATDLLRKRLSERYAGNWNVERPSNVYYGSLRVENGSEAERGTSQKRKGRTTRMPSPQDWVTALEKGLLGTLRMECGECRRGEPQDLGNVHDEGSDLLLNCTVHFNFAKEYSYFAGSRRIHLPCPLRPVSSCCEVILSP